MDRDGDRLLLRAQTNTHLGLKLLKLLIFLRLIRLNLLSSLTSSVLELLDSVCNQHGPHVPAPLRRNTCLGRDPFSSSDAAVIWRSSRYVRDRCSMTFPARASRVANLLRVTPSLTLTGFLNDLGGLLLSFQERLNSLRVGSLVLATP